MNGLYQRQRLTLSLETDRVRLMVVHGKRILRGASRSLPDGVVQNGRIATPVDFAAVVTSLLKQLKGPRRNAIVSINNQRALVRTLTLPPVPANHLAETVRREARRELPLPLDQLYLTWQVVPSSADNTRVFIVGIPRDVVDSLMAGLQAARVQPVSMDLKALALIRAVNRPDVLIANLEEQSGSVVLVRRFMPRLVRTIMLPEQGQESMATVEHNRGESQAQYLIAEIQRTLDFYQSTRHDTAAQWEPTVCLTGRQASQPAVQKQIAARWPTTTPAPPLPLPDKLPLLPYLVNVGLALKEKV